MGIDEQRRGLIEQVLTCGGGLPDALEVAATIPGTTSAHAAIGRLMTQAAGASLLAGSPLAVWAGLGNLDPTWRMAYPDLVGVPAELVELAAL